MRGISWRAYGIGFLAACAMLLFLHVWDRNLTAQIGGGEGSYGGGATAFCVNGIVLCANGGSPVCRYGQPPISCINNTPICSGAGEGRFPPYVVCSAPPSSQAGGGGGSQSGGSSSADPQTGFCCLTDGQPCAPMTFEQCNVSGIGFAQDQATCNRLCGAAMSSSAQSSSATTTTTTCSPPIANQNLAVYGVSQVCHITAPAGRDVVIAQPQKYNGVYGPGQDYIPYNWRVASIASPGWNCQELLNRGVNCSPNGQAAGTIVVTYDAYGQCGFTANVASKAFPAGTPYSALTHSWHNDGTWADYRVPFPACPAGGSSSQGSLPSDSSFSSSGSSDGSGGSADSSGSGRSQSSSSAAPMCGDGKTDDGEECGEPSLRCPVGSRCGTSDRAMAPNETYVFSVAFAKQSMQCGSTDTNSVTVWGVPIAASSAGSAASAMLNAAALVVNIDCPGTTKIVVPLLLDSPPPIPAWCTESPAVNDAPYERNEVEDQAAWIGTIAAGFTIRGTVTSYLDYDCFAFNVPRNATMSISVSGGPNLLFSHLRNMQTMSYNTYQGLSHSLSFPVQAGGRYILCEQTTGPVGAASTYTIGFSTSGGDFAAACTPKPLCSDGGDNDGDGMIDDADRGCQSAQDNDEQDSCLRISKKLQSQDSDNATFSLTVTNGCPLPVGSILVSDTYPQTFTYLPYRSSDTCESTFPTSFACRLPNCLCEAVQDSSSSSPPSSPSSGSPSSGSPSSGSPSSGSPSSGSPSSGSPSSGSPSSGSPSSGSPSSGSPSSGSPSSGSPPSSSRSSIVTTSLACCNPITGQCSTRATCSIWEIEYASLGACAAACRPSSASSTPATHTYCNAEKACKSMSGPGSDQCNSDADCLKDKHLECFMDACRLTTGAGRDLCAKDEDCKVSHAVCLGNKCAREAGAGANQCTTDADCAKTTHLGCLRMACRILGGAGSDLCTKDSDCISTYSICQFRQCTERPGIGLAQCTTDADCMASSSAHSSSSAPILPQCGDGRDNDGDGKKDFPADPGCYGPSDESEVDGPRLPQCSDNVDNDGDGLMDFPDDPGCADLDDATELDRGDAVAACGDGKDNDGDGLIDFPSDPGCSSPLDNSEKNAPEQKHPACGNGILERPSEECDDGNARSFDGCTEHCLLEIGACGDGILQKALGEQCEPPLSDPALPYRCENCRMVFSVAEATPPPPVPFSPSLPSGISPYAFLPPYQLPGVSSPFSEEQQNLPPESWKPKARSLPQRTTETGPELLAIMAAGAAGGWAFLRRRGGRRH